MLMRSVAACALGALMPDKLAPHARYSAAGLAPGDEPPMPWDRSKFKEDSHWGKPAPTQEEFRRALELEGYAVVRDILPPEALAALRAATEMMETVHRDYSTRQRGCKFAQHPDIEDVLLEEGPLQQLLLHQPTIERLVGVFGGLPVMQSAAYDCSHVGTPGISLHTDSQPYGSTAFGGIMFSGPVLVRVLYYLDDLTLDTSPFRCIPRSHLSMHMHASPYTRYAAHPDQVAVTTPAGSAL